MKQTTQPDTLRAMAVGVICMNLLLVIPYDGRSESGQYASNQVTIERVMELALQKVQGEIRKIDLLEKTGKHDWLVEILRPDGKLARIEVDSDTGRVLSVAETAGHHVLGDLHKGKTVYEKLCIMCHGPEGKGDGAFGAQLVPPAANLSSSEIQGKPDHELFSAIKNGVQGSAMQSFKNRLSDQDIRDLLAYVRHFGK